MLPADELHRILTDVQCELSLYRALYGALTRQQRRRANAHIMAGTSAFVGLSIGTCVKCEDTFKKKKPNQIYCSEACRIEGYYVATGQQKYPLRNVTCRCGQTFKTRKRNQRFCSSACRVAGYRENKGL